MKKVAIFVEGHTEKEFVQRLIDFAFVHNNFEVGFADLRGSSNYVKIPSEDDDFADIYFWIINVNNDEKVLSVIHDNIKSLISNGYSKVIGLRDLYPKPREDKLRYVQGSQVVIDSWVEHPEEGVGVIFAIMEIEAWFLGCPSLFESIDQQLTLDRLKEVINVNLCDIDPEEEFDHPTSIMRKIFSIVGRKYDKSKGCRQLVVNSLDYEYLIEVYLDSESKKIDSFKRFMEELL